MIIAEDVNGENNMTSELDDLGPRTPAKQSEEKLGMRETREEIVDFENAATNVRNPKDQVFMKEHTNSLKSSKVSKMPSEKFLEASLSEKAIMSALISNIKEKH